MADWRQIQARIRKAKSAPDPAAQLSELFERTRDGMVAFELAKLREKAGEIPEAVQWYTTAAERFRRPQWRTKAEEALTRLGAPIPAMSSALPTTAEPKPAITESEPGATFDTAPVPLFERQELLYTPASEEISTPAAPAAEAGAAPAGAPARRRHRGHRGGRGRRRGKTGLPATAAPHAAESPAAPPPVRQFEERPSARSFEHEMSARIDPRPPRPSSREMPGRVVAGREIPDRTPSLESPPGPIGWQVRGRAGDPALVSRMSHLESQLRRLLASPLYKLDDADQAPAGPGVFLVTDSDQTSYYHIEACQTLRIGIANQLRADRRAPRGADTLRTKFAEHLGISESQVAKYLNQHCAVRWLQLDEGAAALSHFAIAVLRPVLDET
jgi:hypothetical protein